MYYVENGKNRKYFKAIFFSKSQNRKPLCIMLKIEKIENNLKQIFFEITKLETCMYYVENQINRK